MIKQDQSTCVEYAKRGTRSLKTVGDVKLCGSCKKWDPKSCESCAIEAVTSFQLGWAHLQKHSYYHVLVVFVLSSEAPPYLMWRFSAFTNNEDAAAPPIQWWMLTFAIQANNGTTCRRCRRNKHTKTHCQQITGPTTGMVRESRDFKDLTSLQNVEWETKQ